MPKHELLNTKNLHVVTRPGAGEEIYPDPPAQQRGNRNTYLNPKQEEKLMREAMKFFKNIDLDKNKWKQGRIGSL
jgi:hypothetical protein